VTFRPTRLRRFAATAAALLCISIATRARAFDLTNPNTWPVIPVPEVATDPNGGTTVGLLPVMLFTDTRDQIRDIFAPDANYNTTLGAGGTFRYLSYPNSDTQWYAVAGASWDIARKVDLMYQTGRDRQDWWSFTGRFYFERDPTERFFGIGNHSSEGNESNYTTEQVYGLGILGINLTDQLQFSLTARPKWVNIQSGAFTNLPSIFKQFPDQKGLDGGTEILTRALASYDSRDSIDIPRSGGLYLVYGDVVDRSMLSSFSYTRFGGEIRKYLPLGNRITFASHLFMEYEPAGNEMPFWAQARLGGDDSELTDQQPLRGFGTSRYIDNNLVDINLEMRTRIYNMDLFGTHGTLELAPFFEAGRVAHEVDYDPLSELHPVGGIGFRGIAEPFVVGFVDVGWGGEGAAIFSGINYPF